MTDVTGRLAQGEAAVEHLASYSAACAALGATDPGLAGRLHETYAREAGLDLRALDADHAALTAAAATVREALAVQDGQLAALSSAWDGAAADGSLEVLRRHGEASAQAATALGTAAESMAQLRDALWGIVDAKVDATQSLDARTDGVRGDWLSAAETVTTGAGDRSAASELVDQQVTPFVARDVAADLVAALEEASDAIRRSFDSAIATVRDEPVETFPAASGGGGWSAGAAGPGVGSAPPWTPAGASPVLPPAPAPSAAVTEPAAATVPPPAAPMSMPGGAGLPDLGSGMAGLSGLGQQLGELFGGLLPSGDDLGDTAEPEDTEDPEELEELEEDEPEEDDEEPAEDEEAEEEEDVPPDEPPSEPTPEPPADPAPADAAPVAEQDPGLPEPPAPTPAPSAPDPDAAPTEPPPATPCEIAADELPQAGEEAPTAAAR
ncbi:hypothetical protein MWU83_05535 [Mycolicibacterium sp. F2034L]|nr:hypothetical protein [Mycolicibacterium sp. F2034L]